MKGAYHFRPCPHCGELMRPGSIATHEPVCLKHPAIYVRLRALLTSGDGTHGIARQRYTELAAADKTLPALNTLIRRSKSKKWDGVLAFFKLSPPRAEACRSQCPNCGKLVAGGQMAAHQQECQQERAEPKRRAPKPRQPKPQPAEQPAIACAVAAPEAPTVNLPLPRIAPRPAPAPVASKWAGAKGFDPNWRPPTAESIGLVRVQPGERTCLACGDTFADGGYCIHCGTWEDGTRRPKGDMPPSVPTVSYLQPDEYRIVR